jgi:hypothetical protein
MPVPTIRGNAWVLAPTEITAAMITSSTAAEPGTGEVAWNAATAYALGNRVYLAANHMVYERIIAGTTATSPDVDTTNWAPAGPTNKFAMLDDSVGTVTTVASPLTVVIRPGQCSGLSALELAGAQMAVTVKDGPGGTAVKTYTVNLDDTIIEDVYDWFFQPYVQRTEVHLTDLPDQFMDPEVTFSVTGTGNVSCGALKVGPIYNIGGTLAGASIRIVDYSKKTVDQFGIVTITERVFSKQLTLKVIADMVIFDRVFRLLASLRARPAVYIASTDTRFAPLATLGFPSDWSIDVPFPAGLYCNLTIEGLSQ